MKRDDEKESTRKRKENTAESTLHENNKKCRHWRHRPLASIHLATALSDANEIFLYINSFHLSAN